MGDFWIVWAVVGAALLILGFTVMVTRRRPIRHRGKDRVWQAGHYWTAGGAGYGLSGDDGGCGGGSSGCGGGSSGCGGGGCGGGGCGGGGS